MRTCFVPFCDVKNKDQPNRTMFLTPKNRKLFAQWANALPKVRELKSTDKVCYLHFKPDEVVNTFDHIINDQVIKIKRDRPRLKRNAIPCLEITTEEELLLHRAKCRLANQSKNVKISDNTEKNVNFNLDIEEPQLRNDTLNIYVEVEYQEEANAEENKTRADIISVENNEPVVEGHEQLKTKTVGSEIENLFLNEHQNDHNKRLPATKDISSGDMVLADQKTLFNNFYDNVYDILMPNTLWGIHRCPQRSFICFSYIDVFKMQVIKMLTIKDDGSIHLLLAGNVKTLHLLHDIGDLDSLSILLYKLDVGQLCFGKSTNINCDFIVEPNDDNRWLTTDNEEVFLCKFCLPQ